VKEEVYKKIRPYLSYQEVPENTVLKKIGQVERHARLLLDGVVCHYLLDEKGSLKAQKVYFKAQNAMDLASYVDQVPTNTKLVTKTKVEMLILSKESETELLKNVPEASILAVKINHELIKNLNNWEQIIKLPNAEAYDAIIRLYPNLGNILKVKDFQDILGVGKTTLGRIRRSKT
jgi:CRP/FNR family cyclic AMP-dependent transcriptional regulator